MALWVGVPRLPSQMDQSAKDLSLSWRPGRLRVTLVGLPSQEDSSRGEKRPPPHVNIASHDWELCSWRVSYRVINAGPKWAVPAGVASGVQEGGARTRTEAA